MTAKRTVVVVDDDKTNLMLMEMLFRSFADYQVLTFSSALQALTSLVTQDFEVAIVDYMMPEMDGISFVKQLRMQERHADKPIVMVTADKEADVRLAALDAGAVDFLQKPIEPIEFRVRMKNLLRLSEAQRKLSDRAAWLNSEVEKATQSLREREEEIIGRLSRAAGYKDMETALHTFRVARYCSALARQLGESPEFCRDIQLAAPMHDIGKVGIGDSILGKPGALTDEEREEMKKHTLIGAEILANSSCDLLHLAAEIALTHHERWDGRGYPMGKAGENIPRSGRIAAVADVFDALTTERPYKDAWPAERAFLYLREQAGRQFDPACVEAFERCKDEILSIMRSDPDAHAIAA
ncbi:MAG: response regulator [Rhizobiales bacterium]|nr:response regulator [Hyphomicrobiales bacterium]